jgi:hypothetical protein
MMGILSILGAFLLDRLVYVQTAQSTHVSIFGKSCSFCLFVSSGQACSTREVHLYAQTAQSTHVSIFGQSCQLHPAFFQRFHANQPKNHFFCQKHSQNTKSTAKETTQHSTMMCNNNNNSLLDNDHTRGHPSVRAEWTGSNGCVSNREEGEGRTTWRRTLRFRRSLSRTSNTLGGSSTEPKQLQHDYQQYHYQRQVIHFIDLSTKWLSPNIRNISMRLVKTATVSFHEVAIRLSFQKLPMISPTRRVVVVVAAAVAAAAAGGGERIPAAVMLIFTVHIRLSVTTVPAAVREMTQGVVVFCSGWLLSCSSCCCSSCCSCSCSCQPRFFVAVRLLRLAILLLSKKFCHDFVSVGTSGTSPSSFGM